MTSHQGAPASYLARSFCPRTVRGTRRCRCSTCWRTCLRSGTSWLRNSSSVLHSLEVRKTVTLHGFSEKKGLWMIDCVWVSLQKADTNTTVFYLFFFKYTCSQWSKMWIANVFMSWASVTFIKTNLSMAIQYSHRAVNLWVVRENLGHISGSHCCRQPDRPALWLSSVVLSLLSCNQGTNV